MLALSIAGAQDWGVRKKVPASESSRVEERLPALRLWFRTGDIQRTWFHQSIRTSCRSSTAKEAGMEGDRTQLQLGYNPQLE